LDLKGKRALVCGASQGIGEAICFELSSRGCEVFALARNKEKLEKLTTNLPNKGHKIIAIDVAHREKLKVEVSNLLRDVGPIEILICNTGGPKAGAITDASDEQFLEAFQNHVLVNSLLANLLLPGMKAARYGRIINIISTSVKIPIPNLGVSNTIRAAVGSWAKTLSLEVGEFGVTVNNVLPGFTKTPRLEALIKVAATREQKSEAQIIENWKATIPLRRFAEANEIANVVGFLASAKASYVSGVSVPVDGGRTGSL